MSRDSDHADLSTILLRGRDQGHLTVAELAELLPAETSVEQTAELIGNLQGMNIQVLERSPSPTLPIERRLVGADRTKLLTRAEEVALAEQIAKGKRRRIRAALRAPSAADQLVRAASQVAQGNHSVWEVLADFESRHPDEDEDQARKRLASVARELSRSHDELKRLRNLDKRAQRGAAYRRSASISWRRRMANVRRAMSARLLRLDFHDRFIDRLVSPLLRYAGKVDAALDRLSDLERQWRMEPGALGGTEAVDDRAMRARLKALGLRRQETEQAKRLVKNAKRSIAVHCKNARLEPEDLLATAGEIRSGAQQANQARQRLVEANQRLVMSIARRYPHHSLDFLDLVQEGNLGLMRAADRFDPDLGYRFGTYAAWWVRQSIGRLLAEQGSAVRIPPHVQESLQKINRLSRRMSHKTGEAPDIEELASYLGKSPERIKEILSAGRRPVSTETKVGPAEDSATLLDFLPDPSAGPDEEADRRVQQAILQDAMDALSEREKEIVMLRFHDGQTLQEVGAQFGITRERTRQLQEQALRKLRKRLKADLLRKLIQDQEQQRQDEQRHANDDAKPPKTGKKKKSRSRT